MKDAQENSLQSQQDYFAEYAHFSFNISAVIGFEE